jgi:UPF0716 protein FxsA
MAIKPNLSSVIFTLVLIGFPISEASILILLTKEAGAIPTFTMVSISTCIGFILDWFQWRKLIKRIKDKSQGDLNESKMNMASELHTELMFTMYAFFLFLIPGFLTDIIGLAIIFPPTRDILKEKHKRYMERMEKTAHSKGWDK